MERQTSEALKLLIKEEEMVVERPVTVQKTGECIKMPSNRCNTLLKDHKTDIKIGMKKLLRKMKELVLTNGTMHLIIIRNKILSSKKETSYHKTQNYSTEEFGSHMTISTLGYFPRM